MPKGKPENLLSRCLNRRVRFTVLRDGLNLKMSRRITYKRLEEKIDDWNKSYGLVYRDKGFLKVTNDGPFHELVQINKQGTTGCDNLHLSDRDGTIKSCFHAIGSVPDPYADIEPTGVFTLGGPHYEEELEKQGKGFKKLGKTDDYPGGIACKTPELALRARRVFEKPEWDVYELEADWFEDTRPSVNGFWHALINTSRILHKVEIEDNAD